MQLIVNGSPREIEDGSRLNVLVEAVSDRPSGIAVALNSEVVPRSVWADTALSAGDRVDVVTAVQGG
ncbi:sulfur carrier protein ThiS [Jatrophihabitans telluris]|uniref:Sulfur carrier protein ThiS n=1 Tax=Jatrophihabitans telluris TaxID=2038343 RepID=A0ABY4QZ10_9ACTN|nr:sulfur carrier protein ThiS [Jatrophihabitans telluris]UQX88081.1 sulfur carrier protein ThiS [Jatrophihabitans telluris]